MIDALQIPLAAGDGAGNLIQTLVIVAFVVITIIGGVIQKASKAKAERTKLQAPPRPEGAARQSDIEGLQVLQPEVIDLQPAPAAKPPKPRPAAARIGARRLKPKKTSIESRRVGSAHLGKLEHSEAAEKIVQMVRVDLAAREAARRAMIFHEIFSPPKALRQDAEMWEL